MHNVAGICTGSAADWSQLFGRTANASLRLASPFYEENSILTQDDPTTLIRIILTGVRGAGTDAFPTSPARLDDSQVAAVVTYIRNSWGQCDFAGRCGRRQVGADARIELGRRPLRSAIATSLSRTNSDLDVERVLSTPRSRSRGISFAGSVSSMAADRLASQRCGDAKNETAFCKALRGDRKEDWLGQNRSEVMPVTGS
ncbi:hypothetical protein [Bradyrhizobium sp. 187]|uniref:c-type cytochrome n=1 Tax=Bradyrhizobium sp. 187 TaxID=2782655 RepID=UPI001FFE8B21|nr:hypothetical protein [Bradyrhizobium sp. 187]UPJ71876.1 hypothetical protein IVB19_30470 [Bradyrhizobium sp. 187]